MNQAPWVTCRVSRKVAKQHEWSLEWLVEQCKAELDRPTDTIRRVLEGARVEGNWDDMADVLLPYRCLIELYQRATRPKPALAGQKACACGCGGVLRGKQSYASPACRKRVSRKGENGQKRAMKAATDAA
jgi:hypothetical protein